MKPNIQSLKSMSQSSTQETQGLGTYLHSQSSKSNQTNQRPIRKQGVVRQSILQRLPFPCFEATRGSRYYLHWLQVASEYPSRHHSLARLLTYPARVNIATSALINSPSRSCDVQQKFCMCGSRSASTAGRKNDCTYTRDFRPFLIWAHCDGAGNWDCWLIDWLLARSTKHNGDRLT